jgi:hypothetical protein
MTGVGAISSIPSFVASCELSPGSVSDFDYTISTFPRQDKTQYIVKFLCFYPQDFAKKPPFPERNGGFAQKISG